MSQANDLGNIGNQLSAVDRTRVNANIQALATQHYGAAEPSLLYPNMIWFSSGDGYIKSATRPTPPGRLSAPSACR